MVIAQNTMTVKYLYFLLKRENVQSVEKNSQMREHVAVWLKVPGSLGGFERYKNMVLIHKKYPIMCQGFTQGRDNKRPDKNTQYHKKDARENQ